MPNTKVKILQQLLNQAIEELKKINKIKGISFLKRLKTIVDSYNLRAMDDTEIKQILDEVNLMNELINRRKRIF